MSRTLRFGFRTPTLIDRFVTRRRTPECYDTLMARLDAERHMLPVFGRRPSPPVHFDSFQNALRERRLRFLND